MPGLVKAAKDSGASILIIQELGEVEARQFFAKMGANWGYDRSGLNVIGWLKTEWTWKQSVPVNLSSFSQMQRTLESVILVHKNGLRLRASSSHLAAAASDLTEANAVIARGQQSTEIGTALAIEKVPTIFGADLNSRATSDTGSKAPRVILKGFGWVFDETNLSTDAKRGIDATASNYGLVIIKSIVVDLVGLTDHDGRLITIQLSQ